MRAWCVPTRPKSEGHWRYLQVASGVSGRSTFNGLGRFRTPVRVGPKPRLGTYATEPGRRRDQRDVAIWLWVHRQLTRQVGAFCCADDAAWRRVGQSRAWEHDEPVPPAGAQPRARARPCALAGSRCAHGLAGPAVSAPGSVEPRPRRGHSQWIYDSDLIWCAPIPGGDGADSDHGNW